MMHTLKIRAFSALDRDWVIRQNVMHYTKSDGFDATFAELVKGVVDTFVQEHDPRVEQGWIAMDGEVPVGSIFCLQPDDAEAAQLKLFYLTPNMRGRGFGRRLLEICIDFARKTGRTKLIVRTHESHVRAGKLYREAGFRMTASVRRTSFGVPVVEQHFEYDLR